MILRENAGLVAKIARESTTSTFKHNSPVIRTTGEIFNDGSIIELAAPTMDRHLQLLFWHEQQKKVAPQIEYRGRLYQVPDADETLLRAIRFPSDAVEHGTAQKLFTGIGEVFAHYIGLEAPEVALLTAWSCSTWFPECASSPPTLVISGPDTGHAITLLRLLSCLCRRSLVLTDINKTGLLGVMSLKPTLLVNQPGQVPRIWQLCGTSNYHGVHVLGNQGRVHNLAGSKGFFIGMADIWSDGAVHLALPPASHEFPALDEQRQAEIAERFQPQLLMYRLRNLARVHESHPNMRQLKFPDTEAAHNLAACIQEDPNIAQAIAPILQRQDQDARVQNGCDVARAILEVIWAPLHDGKEIPIRKIADLVNALLRSRGETLEYSAGEIGWKLKNLGFYRHRNGAGKVLQASRETRIISHQLTRRLFLNLPPVHGCADCAQPQVVVAK